MSTNHTVFFTQLYYPDMTTTAIIMSDLAEDLASYGMDIKVVCAQPTYVKNLDPQITPVRSSGPTGQAQITRIEKSIGGIRHSGPRLNIKTKAFTPVEHPEGTRFNGASGVKIGGSLVSGKFPRVESHHSVAIRRVWSFLFDKNKNIGRILNGTSCFLSMLPFVFSASENFLLVFNTNPALLPP